MQDIILTDYEELLANHVFCVSDHADERMTNRRISLRAVHEVLECFQPVEWSQSQHRGAHMDILGSRLFRACPYKILVTGESEIARCPLCVVCRYGERPQADKKWNLHIVTAFDPSTEAYKWADGYTRRVCFCEDEQEVSRNEVWTKIDQYYRSLGRESLVYSTL